MVIPIISAIVGAAAAGGVEGAVVGIGPAIGAAAEITATSALKTAVEVLPKVANPLMAEAVEGAIPNVVDSSAKALKGVEAVAKMEQPMKTIKPTGEILETSGKAKTASSSSESISVDKPINETPKESPRTQIETQDAIYQQKLTRLNELRASRDVMDIEIKQLEKDLGLAKGISPEMVAMIAAAGVASGLNNQIKEDSK